MVLLPLLLGCSPTPLQVEKVLEEVEDGPDSAAPLPVEEIGPAPTVTGLCAIKLDCAATIVDSPPTLCSLELRRTGDSPAWKGRAMVQLRGRSSISFPKPQLAVQVVDDDGVPVAANLLGMGGDPDWVINGAYIDRALLRNSFGYTLFQALGGPERYAPESRSCTLLRNGAADGVYFLVEKIKGDDDRIVIPDDPDGATFVVKLDDEEGILDNSSIGYGIWQVVTPAEPTAAQNEGIRRQLAAYQAAIVAGDTEQIEERVDLDSAIDFVLLQELLRNNDAYFLSVHLWKDVDSGLRFVPWDLDLTLGQPTYNDNANPEGWVAYRPAMIAGFSAVPDFKDRLAARWRDLRTGPWTDAALLAQIDAQHDLLGDELAANFAIWPWEQIPLYWPTLPEVAGPEEEYARIRRWIVQRTAWMDANVEAW